MHIDFIQNNSGNSFRFVSRDPGPGPGPNPASIVGINVVTDWQRITFPSSANCDYVCCSHCLTLTNVAWLYITITITLVCVTWTNGCFVNSKFPAVRIAHSLFLHVACLWVLLLPELDRISCVRWVVWMFC